MSEQKLKNHSYTLSLPFSLHFVFTDFITLCVYHFYYTLSLLFLLHFAFIDFLTLCLYRLSYTLSLPTLLHFVFTDFLTICLYTIICLLWALGARRPSLSEKLISVLKAAVTHIRYIYSKVLIYAILNWIIFRSIPLFFWELHVKGRKRN